LHLAFSPSLDQEEFAMQHMARFIYACGVCFALLIIGCSSDDTGTNNDQPPNQTSTSIGPEGGTLELSGECALSIPAGALSDTVEFTITENRSPMSPGDTVAFVSKVYSIEPSGTNFTSPCTVSIPYNPGLLGGQDEDSVQIGTYFGTSWSFLSTDVDTLNNVASAEINHLSDFSVTIYVRTPATGDLTAMIDASVPGIKFYTKLQDNLHWLLRLIDHRGSPPAGVIYSSSTGIFSFEVDLGDVGVFEVDGIFMGAPVTYNWLCLEWADTACTEPPDTCKYCIDSVQRASGTGPPTTWVDGINHNDIGICSWKAEGDTLFALGTFSIRGLSNDSYRLTLVAANRLYLSDTSMFIVPMLDYNWNLAQYLPETTHWINDTLFVWPTGFLEYTLQMQGDSDSLYTSITFGNDIPTGNIKAYYGADTADASIDWETFVIGD
jgi:hypothetical protein